MLIDMNGVLTVDRWQAGAENSIIVPPSPGGRRGDRVVVATFHTHPNTGPTFQQEPSDDDIDAVRSDLDLKHHEFEGEFVISQQQVFRIDPSGTWAVIGSTADVLMR